MQTVRDRPDGRRRFAGLVLRAAFVAGYGLLVCACNTDQQVVAGVPATPTDYRLRHPITLGEGARTLQIFVGSNRGSLTAAQRAQVLAFAHTWRREATGGVIVEVPVGAANQRTSAETMREIRSILVATGVAPHAVVVRRYPAEATMLAAIRISYPKIIAQAGPCGIWPEDIGPSLNRDHFENQPYWNFGCASQRNLAAMVENPADLVEPRGETPAYTPRRTTVMEKYRQGVSSATTASSNNTGKIATVGQ